MSMTAEQIPETVSASEQLATVAVLMKSGRTVERAMGEVCDGSETRAARLAAIIAETIGHPVAEHDGLRWLSEHSPTISEIIDAGCIAWRCPSCAGTGEVGESICGACGGDGYRRVPEPAKWSGFDDVWFASTAQYELTVRIVWPSPADAFEVSWSALTSDGWGVVDEIRVPLHYRERREDGQARAILAGMLAAEKAVRR